MIPQLILMMFIGIMIFMISTKFVIDGFRDRHKYDITDVGIWFMYMGLQAFSVGHIILCLTAIHTAMSPPVDNATPRGDRVPVEIVLT